MTAELHAIQGGGGGIASALHAFHRDAGKLSLKKTAAGVHSAYLPLDEAMEQIRPLLAEHGLFVRHYTARDEHGWSAGTIIVHGASGETVDSGPFPLAPTKQDPQGWGGALTYARRYSLLAVLGLVGDNDDDGEAASRPKRQRAISGKITSAQRTELMAAIRESKIPTDRAREIVKAVAGVEQSNDIPAEKFAAVLKAVQRG